MDLSPSDPQSRPAQPGPVGYKILIQKNMGTDNFISLIIYCLIAYLLLPDELMTIE